MKMTKFFMGVSFCALALAAVGCSSDSDLPDGDKTADGKMIINATAGLGSIGGSNTRVAIVGTSPKWVAKDIIGVKVDAETTVAELTLNSGEGTQKGTFTGTISESGTKMYAYYPKSAATAAIDLTSQLGTLEEAAKTSVMFATADYSATPSFNFENKTSILKLNMDVPTDFITNGDLTATVEGAYSKGTLGTDGSWSNTEAADIVVSGTGAVTVSDGKIISYVVVIPGSDVKNLSFTVSDGTNRYNTTAYISDAKIENNKIITIGRTLKKVAAYTKEDYFQWDAYSHYVSGTNSTNNNNWVAGNEQYHYGTDVTAQQSCKDCPTANQIMDYLNADHFWDDGHPGPGRMTYTVEKNGILTVYHTGMWFKKGVATPGSTTVINTDNHAPKDWTNDAAIRTSGYYFFLPAAGFFYGSSVNDLGDYGLYWSSTPDIDSDIAYLLGFNSGYAGLGYNNRYFGFLPWVAE